LRSLLINLGVGDVQAALLFLVMNLGYGGYRFVGTGCEVGDWIHGDLAVLYRC
jgi:hypothetical protein